MLANITWDGSPRKVLMQANRSGFFYVLDRTTGKFLFGRPFVKVNWAKGLDDAGRPILTTQPPGYANVSGPAGRDKLVFAVF